MAARLVSLLALIALVTTLTGCGDGGTRSAQATEPAKTTPLPTTTEPASPPTETSTGAETPAPTPQQTTIVLRVVGGTPEGGIARPKVKRNERVVLVVKSDTADEVHFHGYDLSRPVAAGGTARIPFVAKIPGRFEIELENSGVQLAELTVQ